MTPTMARTTPAGPASVNPLVINPEDVRQKARALRTALLAGCTTADMTQVMRAITDRAKRGNLEAAGMLLRVFNALEAAEPPDEPVTVEMPAVSVTVNVGGADPRPAPRLAPPTDREAVAGFLADAGRPARVADIVKATRVPRDRVQVVLVDASWFAVEDGVGYTVTAAARVALLEGAR